MGTALLILNAVAYVAVIVLIINWLGRIERRLIKTQRDADIASTLAIFHSKVLLDIADKLGIVREHSERKEQADAPDETPKDEEE